MWNDETDVFVYSSATDPNCCQLTLHKPWTHLVFAWLRPDAAYVFRIPKEALGDLGLMVNHADVKMQEVNRLFKQSIRFKEEDMQTLSCFLVEIIEQH
jgi:hypothetical protein